jgi:hypothetical protein
VPRGARLIGAIRCANSARLKRDESAAGAFSFRESRFRSSSAGMKARYRQAVRVFSPSMATSSASIAFAGAFHLWNGLPAVYAQRAIQG